MDTETRTTAGNAAETLSVPKTRQLIIQRTFVITTVFVRLDFVIKMKLLL